MLPSTSLLTGSNLKIKRHRAEEMALWIQYLLPRHRDLNSGPVRQEACGLEPVTPPEPGVQKLSGHPVLLSEKHQ